MSFRGRFTEYRRGFQAAIFLFHISDKFPSVFSPGYAGLLIVGILFVISALILPGGRGDPS